MIKLITDTSSLFSPKEAEEMGFIVNPLSVTICGKTYKEFEDINSRDFCDLVEKGNVPTSSQPAIGEVMDSFEKFPTEELLVLTMADGLSGTYQSALSARESVKNSERIHIVNTQTLCGPHRYLTEIALQLVKQNKSIAEILVVLNAKISTVQSFLLPQDFSFLKRGGRCTPIAATLGGLLKLQPVVMATKDGTRLDKFPTGRSFEIAVKKIIEHYKKTGFPPTTRLYISHAFAEEQANKVAEMFKKEFGTIHTEILPLSPAFITQGGPRCIAIQTISE